MHYKMLDTRSGGMSRRRRVSQGVAPSARKDRQTVSAIASSAKFKSDKILTTTSICGAHARREAVIFSNKDLDVWPCRCSPAACPARPAQVGFARAFLVWLEQNWFPGCAGN